MPTSRFGAWLDDDGAHFRVWASDTPAGAGIVAFARLHRDASAIAIAPVLTEELSGSAFAVGGMWTDGSIALPPGIGAGALINVLTGETIVAESENGVARVRLSAAFETLPLALLVPRDLS